MHLQPSISALLGLLATTACLAAPQQPESSPAADRALKTTVDELPEGVRGFNGMLVGRLAAKDVEKGTFVVQVDAIPRVWRNSQAENPKSLAGKTVEVDGVFGKFLDVLIVTRQGDTIEFECKHDGDRLTFPGELLRKVAPYDASDYPVLPEEFRGFQGTLVAEIRKKDPETFELIVDVKRVAKVAAESKAKQPASIQDKPMMLAGFWNRKEQYHDLKVGDWIEADVNHIALRSDHVNVAEAVHKTDKGSGGEKMQQTAGPVNDGLTESLRGFRGMLVGRLVKKDVERGTLTITVDAVPRVWRNNEAENPKSFIGKNVDAEGVHSKLLDALVVTRIGETLEIGALHDGGNRLRVGEVLRKVSPVKPGDYPELPDAFRGFAGTLVGKVVNKDDQLLALTVDIARVANTSPNSKAKRAESIVGQKAVLIGFWRNKDNFYDVGLGERVQFEVEHPEPLSDGLNIVGTVKRVED